MKPKLTYSDYIQAAKALDIDVPTIQAVTQVESGGTGFDNKDRCIIRFEPHIFSQKTKGVYDKSHPTLSYPTWKPGYPVSVNQSWELFHQAAMLSPTAAVLATSWGLFQCMGFNYTSCGCASISEFVSQMEESEAAQLTLFCRFIVNTGLQPLLKAKNWAGFALRYNGNGYKINRYDTKLAEAYARFIRLVKPS